MDSVSRLSGVALASALIFSCAGRAAPAAAVGDDPPPPVSARDTVAGEVRPPADHQVDVWRSDAAELLGALQKKFGDEVHGPERARELGADEVVPAGSGRLVPGRNG